MLFRSGKLNILKENIGNLQEVIGGLIVNALGPVVNKFNDWMNSVGGAEGAI